MTPNKDRHVTLRENSNNLWDLIGPKGNIICEDIRLYSKLEAIEWVRAYVSSYNGWTYEIKLRGIK